MNDIKLRYKFQGDAKNLHFFIDNIVQWLDIEFCDPEKRIVQYQDQLDPDENRNFMYFIYSGHVHPIMSQEEKTSNSKPKEI